MELKVMSLDGEAAGSVDLPDAIFGLVPRTDILHRCVRWQLAKRQRGTHDVKNRAEINRTGKKMYRQKGTGSARHGPAKVNLFRGGGRSFGPTPRSHAIDLPKKVRALALKHALSAKAKDGGIIVLDKATVKDGKTKACCRRVSTSSGSRTRSSSTAPRSTTNFALAARNIPNIDVLPVQGINVYDILRRHMLVLTKVGAGSVGGALQMSTTDPRHYDVIISPVITEKATLASEHSQVMFKVAEKRDQAADQGSGREALRRQGEERQHPRPQRQGQGLQGDRG